MEFIYPQKGKHHKNCRELLDLSRKISPNSEIYLPKVKCPHIHSERQDRDIKTINRVTEEVIMDASFNANFFKALLELRKDTKFSVEENDGKTFIYCILK